MPPRCPTVERLPALIAAQDWVIDIDQAERLGLTRRAAYRRDAVGAWRRLMPGVYLAHPGDPTRRQLLIAALLWAGPGSAIDADDACFFYGVRAAHPSPDVVRIVVPHDSPARDIGFVRVRRTRAPIVVARTGLLRYLEPAAAVIAAARMRTDARSVVALLSDAVQRRVTTGDALLHAHVQATPRNAALTAAALADVRGGARSAPEAEFRRLAEASLVLPPLLYNCLLRLPSGRLVSPDALAPDSATVHETNGRMAHARSDLFDNMQVRHDHMTEAGLIVVHNSPARIWSRGREVIAQFERIHLRYAGRGLPAGVELLRRAA